jgi:hypothetical protein
MAFFAQISGVFVGGLLGEKAGCRRDNSWLCENFMSTLFRLRPKGLYEHAEAVHGRKKVF